MLTEGGMLMGYQQFNFVMFVDSRQHAVTHNFNCIIYVVWSVHIEKVNYILTGMQQFTETSKGTGVTYGVVILVRVFQGV